MESPDSGTWSPHHAVKTALEAGTPSSPSVAGLMQGQASWQDVGSPGRAGPRAAWLPLGARPLKTPARGARLSPPAPGDPPVPRSPHLLRHVPLAPHPHQGLCTDTGTRAGERWAGRHHDRGQGTRLVLRILPPPPAGSAARPRHVSEHPHLHRGAGI